MSDELLWRRDCLGSSDAPAVVGVDPFRSAGDVFLEKRGRLPAVPEEGELGPMALGKVLEPALLDVAAQRLGVPLARQIWYKHPTAPLACSIDGLALEASPPTLIEAKTCGILNRPSALLAAYGEDGTDDVPDSVLIQVQHEFNVLAAQPDLPPIRDALVVALLGDGRGLRTYRLQFNPDLGEQLIGIELEFWRDYVEQDIAPPEAPSLQTLRALPRRRTTAPVPIDPVITSEWLHARAIAKQAIENEETARRFLLAELGDAEDGMCVHGRLSYHATARKAYTVAAQTIRSLRFTPAKEGSGG